MRARVFKIAATVVFLSTTARLAAIDFYASPTGTVGGKGTIESPWDLQTAFNHGANDYGDGKIQPGDTLWLRGGTYSSARLWAVRLSGTARAKVTVRSYPGELARLDGAASHPGALGPGPLNAGAILQVAFPAAWVVIRDIEVMDSGPIRTTTNAGSNPIDARSGGMILNPMVGSNASIDVINCIIHDAGQGIAESVNNTGAVIYGNLIYYNGWDGPDRGHGHSVYSQNGPVRKYIRDNITFAQYSDNLHAYTEGSTIDNITMEGNASFAAGKLSGGSKGGGYNIIYGATGGASTSCTSSTKVAHDPVVKDNYTFLGTGLNYGYNKGTCNPTATGNYLMAPGGTAMGLNVPWGVITISGNTFLGTTGGFDATGYPNNTYLTSRPTANVVFVRPNAYEAGRGNIYVYNWTGSATQAVDLSGVVSPGAAYVVRNAQNYFGPPVATGTYSGGTVTLPMTGLARATPAGWGSPPSWSDDFQAFVVLSTAPTRTTTPTGAPRL